MLEFGAWSPLMIAHTLTKFSRVLLQQPSSVLWQRFCFVEFLAGVHTGLHLIYSLVPTKIFNLPTPLAKNPQMASSISYAYMGSIAKSDQDDIFHAFTRHKVLLVKTCGELYLYEYQRNEVYKGPFHSFTEVYIWLTRGFLHLPD